MREPWDLTRDFVQMMSNQQADATNAGDNALMQIIATKVARDNAATSQGYGMERLAKGNEYATQADTTAFGRQLQRDDTAYKHAQANRLQDRGWKSEDDVTNQDQAMQLAKFNQQMYAEREWAALHPGEPYGGRSTGPARRYADPSSILRNFEGFRDTPYWDTNAFRVGYGSDTYTDPNGGVHRVDQGTRVTREDAERDLARRGREFESVAARQVGPDVWSRLPPNVTAALVSTTYNYGSLPANVVEAVRTGDPKQIAMAVAARGSDNGGVNAKRRQQEAAIIAGGDAGFASDDGTGMRRYGGGSGSEVSDSILNIPVSNTAAANGRVASQETTDYFAKQGYEIVNRAHFNESQMKSLIDQMPELAKSIVADPFVSYDKNDPMYVMIRPIDQTTNPTGKPTTTTAENVELQANPRGRYKDGMLQLDQINLPD